MRVLVVRVDLHREVGWELLVLLVLEHALNFAPWKREHGLFDEKGVEPGVQNLLRCLANIFLNVSRIWELYRENQRGWHVQIRSQHRQ